MILIEYSQNENTKVVTFLVSTCEKVHPIGRDESPFRCTAFSLYN